ncbi:hypothetical protein HHI36_003960 [Cryptolaemus montrouzieri]|uniref:Uncharacterized protein n=1 Tax=Cryptolaemus montrouzieri TaxID=559131 RepID=A0ABD2NQ21_9CUCU
MEENSDSGLVPSLTLVVENIFSSCDPESSDAVSASTLIDFMRPHLSNHPEGVTVLQSFLDPNEENPFISRTSFYEAMKKWTTQIYEGESKLSNISLRESDTNEKNLPFHQSTPKASLAPGSMQDFSNIFNLTNLSGTSMGNSDKSNSTVGCGKLLEEKVKELEFKYVNALSELSMVKSQLALSEEQYAELRLDLDRTNKRLLLEQQVNADLQKSMDHTDEVKEEVFNAKREMEHLQRMWTSAKKENANLVASMKNLELERDQLDAKIIEIRKKDEQRKQELADLRAIVEESKEENKTLKTFSSDLEKKLEEQNSLLKHFSEISEFMKNENHTLRSVIKKAGVLDFTKYPSLKNIPDLSPQGTPTNSPRTRLLKSVLKSSTPFKNMYHPIMFERHVFNSPKFIKQLSSPVSPDGLDTPTDIKTIEFPETGVNLNEQSVDYSGIIDSPKDEIHNLKREEGEELVESDHKYSPSAEIRCDSPDTKIDLGNSISQTMDDLDLSEGSEIAGNKGQDLRSELQGCTFFDNRNNCFNEDHMEWLKIVEEHENCSKIINEYQQRLELLSKDVEVVETENNNLQNKYKHLEENTNYLKMTVNAEKIENEVLVEKNSKLTREITSLHDSLQIKTKEILEMHNIKVQQEKLSEEILKLRSENEDNLSKHHLLLKKYDSLASEKETIEKNWNK